MRLDIEQLTLLPIFKGIREEDVDLPGKFSEKISER